MGWKQKLYELNNPQKYIGDPRKLVYKSSWEEEAFKVCDNNPNVIEWGYEIVDIPYAVPGKTNPNVKRIKKYFPDLYVVSKTSDNKIRKQMIEIKPDKQTKPGRSRNPKTRLYEEYVFTINQLKWAAAEEWCKARGIEFVVVTEKSLFGNRSKR
jgi:hypothetical protein